MTELLAPSKYPNTKNSRQSYITSCNKCDIYKNCMVFDKTLKCTVTGKVYYIKEEMNVKVVLLLNDIHKMFRTVCWLYSKV